MKGTEIVLATCLHANEAYTFPHTADARFALAAYYQSYRMVGFLLELRGPEAVREVVRTLSQGLVSPSDAFVRASGLSPSDVGPRFHHFVQPGP